MQGRRGDGRDGIEAVATVKGLNYYRDAPETDLYRIFRQAKIAFAGEIVRLKEKASAAHDHRTQTEADRLLADIDGDRIGFPLEMLSLADRHPCVGIMITKWKRGHYCNQVEAIDQLVLCLAREIEEMQRKLGRPE